MYTDRAITEFAVKKKAFKPFVFYCMLKARHPRRSRIYNFRSNNYNKIVSITGKCVPTIKKYIKTLERFGFVEINNGNLILRKQGKIRKELGLESKKEYYIDLDKNEQFDNVRNMILYALLKNNARQQIYNYTKLNVPQAITESKCVFFSSRSIGRLFNTCHVTALVRLMDFVKEKKIKRKPRKLFIGKISRSDYENMYYLDERRGQLRFVNGNLLLHQGQLIKFLV